MTDRYLEIKFTYFPSELEMLPIYERLATFKERESSNVLKTLLLVAVESQCIPKWFTDIESSPFLSHRGRTLRLRFDSLEPQFSWWVRHFTPLSVDERILSIKQILRFALLKASTSEITVAPVKRLVDPPITATSESAVVGSMLAPEPAPQISPETSRKSKAFKGQANQYK